MQAYIVRRLLLIIPTLLAILLINFVVIQAAPGGPIDQILATLHGQGGGAIARVTGGSTGDSGISAPASGPADSPLSNPTMAGRGLDPDFIADLQKQFGFDKPAWQRFLEMCLNYLRFDFGESYFLGDSVIDLIIDRLPVSISLGLWSTLIIYAVSIPLGIAKAVRSGSRFDALTSVVIVIGYAIPAFLFAILLIVLFAGGEYFSLFPLRGLTSPNWDEMTWGARIADYFWHMALPVIAMTVGGFATLTMLTRNSFLEELGKLYVTTARAKGLPARQVLYGHVFRNAMLIVIAGFPAVFISMFFTGSLLIEIVFSLEGLGLLGFQAALNRDYPVMFASLYIFTLLGLLLNLVSDLTYALIDPRINFESHQV